jgi:cation transport regulator ChaC
MYNLVVFGSLLHPDELKKHNITMDMIDFVKVKGFRRIFNQEPSWRKIDSNNRAVMNIEEDENSWFNALIIKNLDEEYFEELDYRERGYDRTYINDGDVINYENKTFTNCIVYKGKKGKQNSDILPNIDYFDICLNGAKSHFLEFYDDYMRTTYKNLSKQIVLI